ncbi:hypothetical protein K2173_002558 [Erythroxylum novogranatense]|uniref:Uncharacterized protein n=1 Tax=Erythroxylum novogranatense TaxID=1862640 RepID=A0AAV8TTG0_9ROSI|nr:hypothetical protein K2173_002558 [Erythroxylum novogranatense]
MASAVLGSRNEPYWGDHKVYVRKYGAVSAAGGVDSGNASFFRASSGQKLIPKPVSNSGMFVNNHDPSSNLHFRRRKPSPPAEKFARGGFNGLVDQTSRGGYVTYNLGACSKRELKELKRRLVSELEQVRVVKARLESLKMEPRPVHPVAHFSPSCPPPNGPFNTKQLRATPKSADNKIKVSGHVYKRSNPFLAGPDPKRMVTGFDPLTEKVTSSMMRRCGQILMKLMKLKISWVFNKPVDTVGLGLFDYHQIIQKPMDLGTVKLNLVKHVYKSPLEFAADVRLTFDNAMTYNPKEHEVHLMARQLLAKFNEMFDPAYKKFEAEQYRISGSNQSLTQPTPVLVNPIQVQQVPERPPAPVQVVVEPRLGKLPKPKAKDPNKREMTYAEKAKLGKELEDLPQDKMTQVLYIVRKRNGCLYQDGDEVELDMEVLDTETLWELDRLVCNYKKMMSKIRRQGLIQNHITPAHISQASDIEKVDVEHKVMEENVDIGEDIPFENYPPVEIEKDVDIGCASGKSSGSSGSSSSSDSSSSSGSDSGSSSGNDSDADSVRSPYIEANKVSVT